MAQPTTLTAVTPACHSLAFLPHGYYKVTKPLTITNTMSLRVVGDGNGSVIVYDPAIADPQNYPVFELQQLWACRFQDFAVVVVDNKTALAAFRQSNTSPPITGGAINSVCEWHNVWAGGAGQPGLGGTFTYGWDIDSTALNGPEGNNEEHQWHSCRVGSYTWSAFRLNCPNVLGCRFYDCNLVGGNGAPFGVNCVAASHLYWYGGWGGAHTNADFYLQDQFKQAVIEKWNSEGSARLLATGGPTGAVLPTLILGCRWEGNPPADGAFIVFACPGPLTVAGNFFSVPYSGNTAPLGIRYHPDAGPTTFDPTSDHSSTGGLIHEGNIYQLQVTPTASAIIDESGGTARIRDSRTNIYRKYTEPIYYFGNAD